METDARLFMRSVLRITINQIKDEFQVCINSSSSHGIGTSTSMIN